MAAQAVKRKYSFSDGTLAETGDAIIAFARRDIALMAAFGYDAARIDAIETKINTFKEFSPDEYYTGLMMTATAEKNTAIKNMSEISEGVVRRATTKFKDEAHKIKSFGWAGYISKTDADKMTVNRLVLKRGTEVLAELASEGLTAAILTSLDGRIGLADTAITNKKLKVSERDAAVHQRITLGNDAYTDIVLLADTGKHIHEDTNEALYNDYVIYPSQAGVQTVTGTVDAGAIHNPSVTVDSPDDEIDVIVTEGELTLYFGDDPTEAPAAGQTVVVVNAANPFNGTAADLDWSTTNVRLLMQNNSAAITAAFTVVVRG